MKLFLDDVREPFKYGCLGFEVARNAKQAIELLQTGKVTFASLDHDLAWEHYPWNDTGNPYKEETGYDVLCWIESNNIWPEDGIKVHSMNPVGKEKMLKVIEKHYGRNFQW